MTTYGAVQTLVSNTGQRVDDVIIGLQTEYGKLAASLPVVLDTIIEATAYNEAAAKLDGVAAIDVHDAAVHATDKQIDDLTAECDAAILKLKVLQDTLVAFREKPVDHPKMVCRYVWKNGVNGSMYFNWSRALGRYMVDHSSRTNTMASRENLDIVFGTGMVSGLARTIVIDYDAKTGKPVRACFWTQNDKSLAPVPDGTSSEFETAG